MRCGPPTPAGLVVTECSHSLGVFIGVFIGEVLGTHLEAYL